MNKHTDRQTDKTLRVRLNFRGSDLKKRKLKTTIKDARYFFNHRSSEREPPNQHYRTDHRSYRLFSKGAAGLDPGAFNCHDIS